ncbi:uncharacterized protein CDAR_396331 [Caerostris darwini]|uniref:Uncharacterized protein n=1 Tax=Caerostris darwini TaxID=1538125 RepID=A0AAV4US25_9ARAC|nr:uncharacterized protein CDAR_396331 [Caerostris darwini]
MLSYGFASEETSNSISSNTTALRRSSRKNYGPYQPQPPKDYSDDSEDKDGFFDDSEPSPYNGHQSQKSDYQNYGKFKNYNHFNGYGPSLYPSFAPNYSPFYFPKGNKPGDSASSPDQMMQMMMALSNMNEATKPENGGFLTKLISDPTAASAAIIPLSIVAAAFVPILMNYMMANNAPPTFSTTANNKEGRNLYGSINLEAVILNVAELARAMDGDDCIQKTICRLASGVANMSISDSLKKAVSALALHLAKDDWVDHLGVKNLIDAVKMGNCVNICNRSVIPK